MNIYWYRRVLTVFSISLWGPVPRRFSNVLGHLWLTSGFPQELTPWGPHPAGGLTHQGSCTKAQLPVSILSHSAGESQLELLMGLSGTFYKTALYFHFSSGLCCFLHFLTGIVLNSPIHFLQKNLYLKICFPGTQPKTIGARRGLERKPVVCWLLLEHWVSVKKYILIYGSCQFPWYKYVHLGRSCQMQSWEKMCTVASCAVVWLA